MTSIFENTASKVKVYILHDDTLTDENRQKFIRTAEKYSQGLELCDVTMLRDKIDKKVINLVAKKYSPGSLYRLFIPELLPLDRVIYLDCDILVNMDIREFWELDADNNILVGTPGILHGLPDILRKTLCEIDYNVYINSGVLIMDLQQIRARGRLFDMSVEWFAKHSHLATLPDQDALNSIFRGHIKVIGRKYNDSKFNNPKLDEDISDSIVHTWPHKSWKGLAGFRSDALYWKMYMRSAWGENISSDKLIDIINDTSLRNNPSPKKNLKWFIGRVVKKFLWWSPVRFMNFLRKEATYRIKHAFTRS